MPSKNQIKIAAAGSGKSTGIVTDAILNEGKRILITTFTIEGKEELKRIYVEKKGAIPKNVEIISWMAFLIHECIRPYQLSAFNRRVSSPIFVKGRSTSHIKKTDARYYFGTEDGIFSDKLAEFSLFCNEITGGKVINRIMSMYDMIFIDEFQDFAGYDFDLVIELLKTNIDIRIVADPRQGTFSTNESARNAKYKKSGVIKLIEELKFNGLCEIAIDNLSYRCNQELCDFSDSIYPEYEKTVSKNTIKTDHDGVYIIEEYQLNDYLTKYQPTVLRYDKKTKWIDGKIKNFGAVKGRTYDRTLILPNKPIIEYLNGKPFSSPAKYYVAFTRAKYSMAILVNNKINNAMVKRWKA